MKKIFGLLFAGMMSLSSSAADSNGFMDINIGAQLRLGN